MPLRSTVASVVRRLRVQRPARLALRGIRHASRWAGSVARGAAAVARWTRRSPARRRLACGYRGLIRGRIAFTEALGTPDGGALAIVVCLWNRPGRLQDVLRIVDSQRTDRPLRLVLWNNRPADAQFYADTIAAFGRSGALGSVEIYTSPTNIGGIGRFIAIRELVRRGYVGPFIMMDDDQNVGPKFIDDLLAAYAPQSIAGVWAWTNDGAYWNRTQVTVTGSPADHVGTGGSICDSALVEDEAFFTAIPQRYLFMEDIWMSHYGRRNGWPLRMVASPVEFVLSELDQGHAIFDHKEHFFTWLKGPDRIPLRSRSPRSVR